MLIRQSFYYNLCINTPIMSQFVIWLAPTIHTPTQLKKSIPSFATTCITSLHSPLQMATHPGGFIIYAIKWGADNIIAKVESKVKVTQTHKHSLSITNAANFHSLFICSSSSICLILDVIFFNSLWIAIKSWFKISVISSLCFMEMPDVGCWHCCLCDVGGLIQSSGCIDMPHIPFSARARYSSSVSNRFGSNACALLSCNGTSPDLCLMLCRRFSIPGLFSHNFLASQPLRPLLTYSWT